MHWKLKALMQQALSRTPGGGMFYSFLQRKILRSLPLSRSAFLSAVEMAQRHVETIRRNHETPLDALSVYEFGAGASLTTALTFFANGVGKQLLTDISPSVRADILQHTITQFADLNYRPLVRLPEGSLSAMNIEYLAPSPSVLPRSGEFDVVTSTSVLEHIPESDLRKVIPGLRTMLKEDGLMIHHIAYSDHFSDSMGAITPYNYLQYSDVAWRKYNSKFHFQNRLRHSDYLRLISESGFEIISAEVDRGTPKEVAALRSMKIDSRFSRYDPQDLEVLHGYIVARRVKP